MAQRETQKHSCIGLRLGRFGMPYLSEVRSARVFRSGLTLTHLASYAMRAQPSTTMMSNSGKRHESKGTALCHNLVDLWWTAANAVIAGGLGYSRVQCLLCFIFRIDTKGPQYLTNPGTV